MSSLRLVATNPATRQTAARLPSRATYDAMNWVLICGLFDSIALTLWQCSTGKLVPNYEEAQHIQLGEGA